VFALATEVSEIRKILERLQPGGRECRTVPEKSHAEESVETGEIGEPRVGEWTINEEVIGFCLGAHQAVLDRAAVP